MVKVLFCIDDILRPRGRTIIFSQHYFPSTAGVMVSVSYSIENHRKEGSGELPPQNKNYNSNYNNILFLALATLTTTHSPLALR